MDYSLRGYLERRSTEELDIILVYAINNNIVKPEDTVKMIIEILEEREKKMEFKITPQYRALSTHYLQIAKEKEDNMAE